MVEFGGMLNLGLLLTQGVGGMCPVEMVKLSKLVELSGCRIFAMNSEGAGESK